MAVKIPTLKKLFDDIKGDLNTEFNITIPLFGKVFLNALAAVLAGQLKLVYLTISRIQKNVAPDTADPESKNGTLERLGRIILGRNPFPPTNGIYNVGISGTPGSTIKANTTFKSDDNSLNPGQLYIIDADVVLSAVPPDLIPLRSLETGANVTLSVDDTLTATSPITGVDKQVTVISEDTQPIDSEKTEQYRALIIQAEQLEPQGGAGSDYRIWAADAQGVREIYPFADENVCSGMIIHIEATVADGLDDFGTPTAQIIQDVESVINFDSDETKPIEERGRRPTQVGDIYKAIVLKDVDIEITNFTGLTPEIQANIQEVIIDLLFDIRPFVATADIPKNQNDALSTNKIITAIASVIPNNVFFDTLELKVDNTIIVSNFIFTNGNIPKFNTITYV